MADKLYIARCAYCDEKYPITLANHKEHADWHLARCPGHPMRKVEGELVEAKKRIKELEARAADTRHKVRMLSRGKHQAEEGAAALLVQYRDLQQSKEHASGPNYAKLRRELEESNQRIARLEGLLRRADELTWHHHKCDAKHGSIGTKCNCDLPSLEREIADALKPKAADRREDEEG